MKAKMTVEETWNGEDVKIRGKRVTGKTAWETGLIIEGNAKVLSAVNNGYLAASITTQSVEKGSKTESPSKYGNGKLPIPDGFKEVAKPANNNSENVLVVVGTPVTYGPYVEFLTRPFLRPAMDMAQGRAISLGEVNGRIEFKDYLVPKGGKVK